MQRKASRRDFVLAASVGVLTHILLPRRSSGASQTASRSDHPTPRAGITADAVLTKAQLSEKP
ncbi:MAG: hypothetical protein ABI877_23690, partial [Gemmatimonadaceae bacterium]